VTTIAYKNGVLAADSLINYGTFSNGEVNKIHVVAMPEDDGKRVRRAMMAVSGAVWVIEPLIEWIESGASQDDIPHCLLAAAEQFSCIMIDDEGTVWEFNNGFFLKCGVQYHSIGSGQMFALGAMAAGIEAPEAVAAAMKHDKATGGAITVCTVADLQSEVRKAA
jgi:ATP-dependent protease HslVU (ClpYQ) peptidase subunit